MLPFSLKCQVVADMEKLELVKLVVAATNTAVEFNYNGTLCPVCALANKDTILGVKSTVDEIRYCYCEECKANVKAVGRSKKDEKKLEIPAEPKIKKPVKKVKAGKKKKKTI